MTAYYNEYDPKTAAWLRELIKRKLIADGFVDERSIVDVKPEDLKGFTQCHFFAGIGGWSYALKIAGVDDNYPLWTGSPPCQPFSLAGKQLGQLDKRHLAPTFMRLIAQCRPSIIFGEQVAAAIGKHWLDDLFLDLERQGYSCGAAVLPAASVGAPHKRDRLFFGAHNLADADNTRPQRRERMPECANKQPIGSGSMAGSVADSDGRESRNGEIQRGGEHRQQQEDSGTVREGIRWQRGSNDADSADPRHGFWSDVDWLGCRDGKFRPVEPGTFPLANGIPARVGRLRGYGNAIVPQIAAEFIKAFMGAINDAS